MEWIEPNNKSIPEELLRAVGGHPLVSRALINRGIVTAEAAVRFLDPTEYEPSQPSELPEMELAADRVERAVRKGETICVWGDFDVDGQTATTVLLSVLQLLGAEERFYIPLRKTESHGFSTAGAARLIQEGVSLFITCDTGIRDHEAVEAAAKQGADVIVTDHHDPPSDLPPSLATLNPKLLPRDHPMRELPGVGTAFLLAQELLSGAGKSDQADSLLDLVALGIVADLARQFQDVRYYLQRGLHVLRRTERSALVALMETAKLSQRNVTESDIGFALAPRLNALGRLGDANRAVKFLMSDDAAEASEMAQELEALNARRKLLTDQVLQAALEQLAREPPEPAIVVQNDTWPEGVIGLVAGRLADRYGRPAIIISTGDDHLGRASARSVPGIDISAAIKENSQFLERYGGHPAAAGFTIRIDQIAEFRRALFATLADAHPRPARLRIDAVIPLNELNMDLIAELERLAPFGPGNAPTTLVSKGLTVSRSRGLGRGGDHLEARLTDPSGAFAKFIWWGGSKSDLPKGAFDLAYRPRTTTYKDELQMQLEWIDARPVERAPPVPIKAKRPELVDLRNESDSASALLGRITSDAQIWVEVNAQAGVGRQDLTPSEQLVIWTIPPGPSEMRYAVRRARPEVVYVFAERGAEDSPETFLKALAGLAKYSIRQKEGRMELERAAARLGHRESTVEAGLNWLEARGELAITERTSNEWRVRAGDGSKEPAGKELEQLLRETAAFRDYYRRASTAALRRLLW